ncbi:MAG: right-handed parallel beta-helix repeat-containing protein [Clostridia bacterium]|nr:right-handed parallel beta-helix repeat-containing protein [Clostridia bacterium]MBR7111929.1 right-handed parallel beta-helix repeat-containing protein [Clostridia bacterium]
MKKKILVSSILTIALCLSLIAGSTFALFTHQDEVGIEINAANVEMRASISPFVLESVKPDAAGNIVDEFGGKYSYVTCQNTFLNGGTAELSQDSKALELSQVTPGDRVSFDVLGKNDSDVIIMYRYIVECIDDRGLMSGLNVTIDGVTYPVLSSYTSVWTKLDPGQDIDPEHIVIELPVTAGNEYEKKSVSIKIAVEAVQGNADVGENLAPTVEFLPGYTATVATDRDSLQAALNNTVEGDNIIVLTGDIQGDVVATQKANTTTVLLGNGKNFDGVLTVDGKSATITTAALTIKDLVFSADAGNDACIKLGPTNASRYVCNVTVMNCLFDVPEVVGVKSYTGGDYDVAIINCTATARAHSLANFKNVNGILVENCTVNSQRGLNLNNSDNIVINKCTFNVQKYAVRFGSDVDTIPEVENFTISNSTVASTCVEDAVIVFRAGASDAKLTLVNTELSGPVLMMGHENATIITK